MNVIAYTNPLQPIIEDLPLIQTDYFVVETARVNTTVCVVIVTIILILNTLYWLICSLKKQKQWVESVVYQIENQHKQQTAELTKNTEQLRSEFEIHQELYRAEIDELNQLLHAKTIQIEEFAEIFAQTNSKIEYMKGMITQNARFVEINIRDLHKTITNIQTQLNDLNTRNGEFVRSSIGQLETCIGMVEETANKNVEKMKCEINKLQLNICNSDIHIGYNIRKNGCNIVVPVFESPKTTNIFNNSDPGYDCIIIRQLRFLRNITKINIMNVGDIMFIFDNVELNELYSKAGKGHRVNRGNEDYHMLNIPLIVKENNPKYFVLFRGLLGYNSNNNNRLVLFNEPHDVDLRAYMKNGIRELYERLRDIQIELTMPSELREFVLRT